MMSINTVTLLYLIASVCFIQSLKGLSHPTTSIRGNLFGMVGMGIAIFTTAALVISLSSTGGAAAMGLTWVILALIAILCARRHILMLTRQDEPSRSIAIRHCTDMMPLSRCIAYGCKTVQRNKCHPLAVSLADKPIPTVLGMCASIRIDLKELHTRENRIDLTHLIANS